MPRISFVTGEVEVSAYDVIVLHRKLQKQKSPVFHTRERIEVTGHWMPLYPRPTSEAIGGYFCCVTDAGDRGGSSCTEFR